jgi:hypothetical protein
MGEGKGELDVDGIRELSSIMGRGLELDRGVNMNDDIGTLRVAENAELCVRAMVKICRMAEWLSDGKKQQGVETGLNHQPGS